LKLKNITDWVAGMLNYTTIGLIPPGNRSE